MSGGFPWTFPRVSRAARDSHTVCGTVTRHARERRKRGFWRSRAGSVASGVRAPEAWLLAFARSPRDLSHLWILTSILTLVGSGFGPGGGRERDLESR